MPIQDLFLKPIDRTIEGVIKADDQRFLQTEVDEFVITKEIEKGLIHFSERYLHETNSNGVWISGFFGSGKSHLLKILSLILDRRPLAGGARPAEVILPKIEDEVLRADLQKAAKIPSHSILFNIDQKAPQVNGDGDSAILGVFIQVLNELRGYHSKPGHIAKFEYDLDRAGQLETFKKTYLEVNGRAWESDRDSISTVRKKDFAKAFTAHSKVPEEEAYKVLSELREDYSLSIEEFAQQVMEYIEKQGSDFRLNFFVDEVGQFIGENSRLMLNLQTVAETLSTVCNGRAWVFVTSQSDLASILGKMRAVAAEDFSKIEARFKTRLNLTPADVVEVISKRLLIKKDPEPELLTDIYDPEKENLTTLFRFGADSLNYNPWSGSAEFCTLYPFAPFHFELFQKCMQHFSTHEMFHGTNQSVGARPLLVVCQSALKEMQDSEVGALATFDMLYDGIEPVLAPHKVSPIAQAPKHIHDPLAIRVLKSLFLLKWEKGFKANLHNIAILLIDRPNINIETHQKAVKAALDILCSQSCIQQIGEFYEFLSDAEKDVEMEIKATSLDESQVVKLLSEVLFADVLKDQKKIRYSANGQDYVFATKLDDNIIGKTADIAINIITPDHPNYGSESTLAAQNSGKAELMVIFPSNLELLDEVRLYKKTESYIQTKTGSSADQSRQAILRDRGVQNSARRGKLKEICADLFVRSPIYLGGNKIAGITATDPVYRFQRVAQDLIAYSYRNLTMLRGAYDEASLSRVLLEPDDLLAGGGVVLSEADQEVLNEVSKNQTAGVRISAEDLVKHFSNRPYGWYPMAVCNLIARLYRMNKIELRVTELADPQQALEHLVNSSLRGSLRIRLQEQFDAAKVAALKKFHREFFDRLNDGADARSVGQNTHAQLVIESATVQGYLDQKGTYPFLSQLQPLSDQLQDISEKDYAYLLNHLEDFKDTLLTAKKDLLDRIKEFMQGAQRKAYDDAIAFARDEAANFSEIDPAEVQPLSDLKLSDTPFRETVVPEAKAATLRLRGLIDAKLTSERDAGAIAINDLESKIKDLPEFKKLSADDQLKVLARSAEAKETIHDGRFITSVRDRISRYRSQDYPAQVTLVDQLIAAASPKVQEGGKAAPAPIKCVPLSELHVKSSLPYIGSSQELDDYLQLFRAAALEEIKKGKRLTL